MTREADLLDMRSHQGFVWDEALRPEGEGVLKEPFSSWWHRNSSSLSHLHPQIAEQWVYRHWRYTTHGHIPLPQLTWRLEQWATSDIVDRLRVSAVWDWDAEFDYETFHENGYEPARTMDATGTWNMPVVLMETPRGALTDLGELVDVRYWLIEGRQRLRYLHALHVRSRASETHAVFVLAWRQD